MFLSLNSVQLWVQKVGSMSSEFAGLSRPGPHVADITVTHCLQMLSGKVSAAQDLC